MPRLASYARALLTRSAVRWAVWLLVIWIVVFWRLGYPSFWDPGDEAQYAQASREMLASGDWLAPTYNGRPFFDKPILFYALQMLAFRLVGPTEFAARLVPACSTLALLLGTAWLGAKLFNRRVASLGALMVVLLPATFALSSYAILDMTFTALLFSGLAMIAVAALRDRPRLQYPGYILIALAVLTKGPLALALTGCAFALALLIAPDARRPLLRLRWVRGLGMVIGVSAPWFLYMWWRFGSAFVDGYVLRENLWLFTRGLPGPAGHQLSYLRVVTVGLLPWTPLLVGRLVDIARGDRCSTEERVLWAWSAGVIGFFTFSRFKLDHYVYPAAPALCLLAGQAWSQLRDASSIRRHAGTAAGALLVAVMTIVAGVRILPFANWIASDLAGWVTLASVALMAGGAWLLVELAVRRFRPPQLPLSVAGAMLVTYSVVLVGVLPRFEDAKPVRALGQWLAAQASASTAVGAYGIDRWNTSWRFYAGRPVEELRTKEEVGRFFSQPGERFCLMLQRDVDALASAGYELRIERRAPGLFQTTGRAISRARASNWQTFVIVSSARRERP